MGLCRALLDTLFPPLCHLCKSRIRDDHGGIFLCPDCRNTISSPVSPLCTRCGVPFAATEGIDHLCGACTTSPPPFTSARSATVFTGAVRDLIHRFKYDRKVHLYRVLGLLTATELAEYIASAEAELVMPVPLHVRRLRERGFNQSILIGEICARSWSMPMSRCNLSRVRYTTPQTALTAVERHRNVRGAFTLLHPDQVTGKRIVLLDDVYTTGSTVSECARVLKAAGAAAVTVATTARAVE